MDEEARDHSFVAVPIAGLYGIVATEKKQRNSLPATRSRQGLTDDNQPEWPWQHSLRGLQL
jgi:hypothetical protein